MRMSESRNPKGIASGKATMTMASAIRKPEKMIGRLVTMSSGFRNKRRNRLAFHAWTKGCASR